MTPIEALLAVSAPDFTERWTDDQLAAALRVVEHQGPDRLREATDPTLLTPWVGLAFDHIYIGIEPDGYAHS